MVMFMNNKLLKYDVAIIGGGAAGLFCAIQIKRSNSQLKVAIIESQDRVGKKLLTTGNGRCNLTNLYTLVSMYHGSFTHGAEYLLNICPPSVVVGLFEEMGLVTYNEDDGRVYPVSKQANSVLDVLRIAMDKHQVEVVVNSKVTDIKKSQSGFDVICDDKHIFAEKLVVATGSKSTPSTGADDSMWSILKKLGHNIISPVPSLCPVFVDSPYLKSIKGVRASGKVRIMKDNTVLGVQDGEVQFTEKALSGICVFNLARIANAEDDTEISVSLLPDWNFGDIFTFLRNKKTMYNSHSKAEDLLIGVFNKMLDVALLKSSGISPSKMIAEITDSELKKLSAVINDWRFKVIPAKDFSKSQVTAGGVDGLQIDENTMKSKVVNDLYIIGEVVDCDGDCGGMNLQFAFSSAYCAACDITL